MSYMPQAVAVGDINGDGKPDIVVADLNNVGANGTTVENDHAIVSVLLNTTPTGADVASFAPRQDFAAGTARGESLALGDFNGDGRLDAAITNDASEDGTQTQLPVVLLLNAIAPGANAAAFAPAETFPAGLSPDAVAVGDINGDGRPDRSAADAEVAGWVNQLPQLGQQGVAQAFLSSVEFRTDQFEGYYEALLHRHGDAAGLSGWAQSNIDIGAVRNGFEASSEFFANR